MCDQDRLKKESAIGFKNDNQLPQLHLRMCNVISNILIMTLNLLNKMFILYYIILFRKDQFIKSIYEQCTSSRNIHTTDILNKNNN